MSNFSFPFQNCLSAKVHTENKENNRECNNAIENKEGTEWEGEDLNKLHSYTKFRYTKLLLPTF